MDAKKLGRFIAQVRKEQGMTQLDLAQKLFVTDKAISKWERGLGLPDINTLEPLSEALGITIVELMRAERIPDTPVSQESAAEAVTETIDLVKHQRRLERKQLLWIGGCVLALAGAVYLVDALDWFEVIFIIFPWACAMLGAVLAVFGVLRAVRKLPCLQTFVWAGICGLIAASPLLIMLTCLVLLRLEKMLR